MPVDGDWKLFAAFGGYTTHMPCYRSWSIQALPSEQLRTPSQICVFAICEELLVEKLSLNSYVPQHFVTVECRSPGRSKNVFLHFELPLIQLFSATIQMTEIG